jgi:exodeoxyribonuclease VII small subunit
VARKKDSFDFEAALLELEKLVQQLEGRDLKLEDALACFERGVNLSRACQQALAVAEQRVQVLIEKSGKAELQGFDPAEPGPE